MTGQEEEEEEPRFKTMMRNGMLLREEKAVFVLAFDLLMGIEQQNTELLGLVVPKGAICDMNITLVIF